MAEPPIEPCVVNTSSEQIAASGPASTITPGLIVTTMSDELAGQAPIGSSVVSVNVTEPAFISSKEGVYTGFNISISVNKPVPPDHCAELAPPPKEPFKVTSVPAQMMSVGPPASTSVVFLMVIENVSGVPEHPVALIMGVIVIFPILSGPPGVAAVNEAIFPAPDAPRPIEVLSFVQPKTVDGTDPVKFIGVVDSPSQYSKSPGFTTSGMG